MRIKLSYTVDESAVLKETAKLINLSTEDLQQAAALFTEVQQELVGAPEAVPNVQKSLGLIERLREALLTVDTRLVEAAEIVTAYDDYRRGNSDVAPESEVD